MAKKEIIKNDLLTVRVDPSEPLHVVEDVATAAADKTKTAASAVLDVLENEVDQLEGRIDDALNVTQRVARTNPYVLVGVAVVATAVGAGVTYVVLSKRLKAKYADLAEREIAEAREFFSKLEKTGEFETPQAAAEKLLVDGAVEAINEYSGNIPDSPETDDTAPQVRYDKMSVVSPKPGIKTVARTEEGVVVSSVFPDPVPDGFDLEREAPLRSDESPYVISHEEFLEAAPGYDQTTLTYYEGDDVLADESDRPIDNVDFVVGTNNLARFGHGSKDANVVYVRNDHIEDDYEIIRSRGSFAEVVHGVLQHSDDRASRRPQRFRRGDDE